MRSRCFSRRCPHFRFFMKLPILRFRQGFPDLIIPFTAVISPSVSANDKKFLFRRFSNLCMGNLYGCPFFALLRRRGYLRPVAMVPENLTFSFDMYPHFFDGAKKRRYPSKKRFPTPAVCSRKRCPLHKGTKTLHRKNGGSDSRPPSFRPTAVFILHLPPGYFRPDLTGWGFPLIRQNLRFCHLPPREG